MTEFDAFMAQKLLLGYAVALHNACVDLDVALEEFANASDALAEQTKGDPLAAGLFATEFAKIEGWSI